MSPRSVTSLDMAHSNSGFVHLCQGHLGYLPLGGKLEYDLWGDFKYECKGKQCTRNLRHDTILRNLG